GGFFPCTPFDRSMGRIRGHGVALFVAAGLTSNHTASDNARVSATPMIDRLEPLPTPHRPVDWGMRAGVVVGLAIVAVVLLALSDLVPPLTQWVVSADAWFKALMRRDPFSVVMAIGVLLAGIVPIVAIHEAGHVL